MQHSSETKDEIEYFTKYADEWWNDSSTLVTLHKMNDVRVPFIRDGLIDSDAIIPKFADSPQPLTGLKILDVGCGGGFLSEPLAQMGANVLGIDPASHLIRVAKMHSAKIGGFHNLQYANTSVREHAKNHADEYDAVVVSEVIEHIENNDKRSFVEDCVKCLKPKGSLFFTTFDKTVWSYFIGIWFLEYIMRLIPIGTHDWELFITPNQLEEILEKNGCITTNVKRFRYSLFEKTWQWKSQAANYALQAIRS